MSAHTKLEPVSGNTRETHPLNNSYFPALDGIRTLAFVMVFAAHYLEFPWGWAGVDVFFVLSGFLITGILYDTRDAPNRVHNFYVRRTLRIFPLYYACILLLIFVYPIFHWQWNWGWLVWPAYLGNFTWLFHHFSSNPNFQALADAQPFSRSFPQVRLFFGHFWSLCVEEQFYLVWPWVVFWIKDRRKLIYLCLFFIVACPLLRVIASHTLSTFLLQKNMLILATPLRIDSLLLGGLIALARRGPSARRVLPVAQAGFACIGLALAVWLALRLPMSAYMHPSWQFTWGMFLVDALSACLIVFALEYGSIVFHVFSARPLRWFGRLTYGVYVFHDIPHMFYVRLANKYLPHPQQAAALIAFFCTTVFAWASYRWFEKPFIRLKERWTR